MEDGPTAAYEVAIGGCFPRWETLLRQGNRSQFGLKNSGLAHSLRQMEWVEKHHLALYVIAQIREEIVEKVEVCEP